MNKLSIILLLLFTVVFCYFSVNAVVSSLVLAIPIVLSILYVKIDLLNPVCWYVPFIYIYHISVIFSDAIGLRYCACPNQIVFATSIAVYTTLIMLLLFNKNYINYSSENTAAVSYKILKTGTRIFFITTLILLISYVRSGIVSKSDANISSATAFLNYSSRIYIMFAVFLAAKKLSQKRKHTVRVIFLQGIFLTAVALITGERDILFCFILTVTMLLVSFKRIKKPQLIMIILAAFIIIPITGEYKNILYIKDKQLDKENSGPLLVRIFLTGEFIAGGKNLETIILYERDRKNGESIIEDIERAVVPPVIKQTNNSVGWFARKYYNERFEIGQGLGFSIIAEGYINFGYWGICIWFIIISSLLIFLRRNAATGIYGLIIYILIVPNFIYALRGDLSSILSPLLKQILIPIFFIKLLTNEKKTTRNF